MIKGDFEVGLLLGASKGRGGTGFHLVREITHSGFEVETKGETVLETGLDDFHIVHRKRKVEEIGKVGNEEAHGVVKAGFPVGVIHGLLECLDLFVSEDTKVLDASFRCDGFLIIFEVVGDGLVFRDERVKRLVDRIKNRS